MTGIITRRGFLRGLGAIAAPAIIPYARLMPVKAPPLVMAPALLDALEIAQFRADWVDVRDLLLPGLASWRTSSRFKKLTEDEFQKLFQDNFFKHRVLASEGARVQILEIMPDEAEVQARLREEEYLAKLRENSPDSDPGEIIGG